jgi:hypothetical protein
MSMQERKIAVIAVHGVGDRKCGEMAAHVVRQLQLSMPDAYRHFETTQVSIAVTADELRIAPTDHAGSKSRPGIWPSENANSRLLHKASAADPTSIDVKFTETLLEEGGDYQADYQSLRQSSTFESCGTRTRVDVHEMFWADLSHGGVTNAFAVFSELMQFFLHMASLGRTTMAGMLQLVSPAESDEAKVGSMYKASAVGYWLLAIPILMGNVLFLAFGILLMILLIPDLHAASVPAAAVTGGVAGGLLAADWMRSRFKSPSVSAAMVKWGIAGVLVAGAFTAAGLYGAFQLRPTFEARNVLFGCAALLLALLGTALMDRYDKSRPGALFWWKILLALVACTGIGCAVFMSVTNIESKDPVLQWYALFTEACFKGLFLSWLLLYICNFRLLYLCLRANLKSSVSSDVKRATHTSLIAASIPAPLLISVILFFWLCFLSYLKNSGLTRLDEKVSTVFFGPQISVFGLVEKLVGHSVTDAFLPYLACLLVAILATAIGILPSVIAEFAPPTPPHHPPQSHVLGNWLDGGFYIVRFGGVVSLTGFFFLLPFGMLLQFMPSLNATLFGAAPGIIPWSTDLGYWVGGATVAFLASTKLIAKASLGKISKVFANMRVLVDTLIDVDNWLRERPVGTTPRLRIMARYVSLLKDIADADYDGVVIVAHSQGGVVTADLFRYLVKHNPELIAKLNGPSFFTVGCPLRQLYALRFPGLYGWADNPSLDQSGFAAWINAYGSGDYVGRYLWHEARAPERWTPGQSQREFCVGPIAHTHYFDKYAPAIGMMLIDIIGAIQPGLSLLPPGRISSRPFS